MKKILIWVAVITTVMFVFVRLLPDASENSTDQNAAIAVIKNAYSPSAQLLSWNPDLVDAFWIAAKYPESLSGYKDCYLVQFSVDVIPAGEKKTITARWLVCDGNKKYQTQNAEAQTLFVSR
jgi:hypothetical protein